MFGLVLRRMVVALLAIAAVAAALATGCVSEEDADDFGAAQESEPSPTLVPTSVTPTPSPTEAASPEPTAAAAPTPSAPSAPSAPTPSSCPDPLRVGPNEAGPPIPESELGWPRVEGTVSVGRTTLHLPAGRQFLVSPFVVKPSGPTARDFLLIYDVQTGSVLHVTPDGCELYRSVRDLAVDPVFDEIVASVEVGPPILRWPNPFPTDEEVELGPDGKYAIRGRADGCDYSEDQQSATGDGRTWVLMQSSECYPVGLLIPGDQSALEVVPIPTPTTVGTPEPPPTPTPEPGVCPAPGRTQPPPLVPESQIVGWRVQGGASFSAGYLTIRAPAGRELAVMNYWDGSEAQQYLHIGDVETQSGLAVRGDGCESYRSTRDPAVDAVFDEVVATLEVSRTYVCTPSYRKEIQWVEGLSAPSGRLVRGGEPSEGWGLSRLTLPPGREFVTWGGIRDPGGGFLVIYDIATQSRLILGDDGCEEGREIADPAAHAVFDEIVRSTEVPW